ncbi:sensor domain-containing diguanylate cyclase [Chitinilyticum litopenaei]|uniref:sensor domain-containing diguanylate cyclase n=1 Tax=Chitinilyticum litopenaei TaxID=1121276 RepID=UPI00042417FA|nr:sensor domain-containing diguanylate cyclase [Chitinilyticum litopenaei]
MPILLDDGSLYGTLCAASSERKPLNDQAEQVLLLFANLISQHIQKEQLVQQLHKANAELLTQSHTDALTALPNRRAILAGLAQLFAIAQRSGRQVLIAFVDLDGFKQINDQYGHDAGDVFLQQAATRLQSGIRQGDLLGRLGGDEFVAIGLGPEIETEAGQALAMLKSRLGNTLLGEYTLPGCRLDYAGASIGAVAVHPGLMTTEQAMQQADAAMYAEKKSRRGR